MRLQIVKKFFAGRWRASGAATALAVLAGTFMGTYSGNVQATAAFARQTGMSCHACHTRAPSMTATGKRFFMRGYRTPAIRERLDHGEPGTTGGRFNLNLSEFWWFRTRVSPLKKDTTETDPEKDGWWAEIPNRFALGWSGPIGDYVSVFVETYYQPYEDDAGNPGFENRTATGAWRKSLVEVDELELVFGKEMPGLVPGNFFGLTINNRQHRYVNNRGGTSIASPLEPFSTDNGGVGAFAFWDDKYYATVHLNMGKSNNWDKFDTTLNFAWWPFNTQQNDLFIDVTYIEAHDGEPEHDETAFGGGVDNVLDVGRSIAFRGSYVKADWGLHTIDTEAGISYGWEESNVGTATANSWKGAQIDIGGRYYYKRRWGFEVIASKWLLYEEESLVTGQTLEYDEGDLNWEAALLYNHAANVLITLAWSQENRDQVTAPGATPRETGDSYELEFEFNY